MTRLDKPLTRLIEVAGMEIVLTVVPEDAGIPAHIKLRRAGDKKSFRTLVINPPSDGELKNR